MNSNDDTKQEAISLSCTTLTYKGLQKFWGELTKCVSCPLLCLGIGPVKVVEQGCVGVLTRFGVFQRILQPGMYSYNYMIDDITQVCVMMQTMKIPPQEAMTRDNVVVTVNAVTFYTITDATRALFQVESYYFAIKALAASTLLQTIGEHTLQDITSDRNKLNERITKVIQKRTADWGIEVNAVQLQDIGIPQLMQRVIAAMAESTREADAKVITAEGQKKAAHIFCEAAETMSRNPMSLQLQWFETLRQISFEKHQTYIVPSELMGSGLVATLLQQEFGKEEEQGGRPQKRGVAS